MRTGERDHEGTPRGWWAATKRSAADRATPSPPAPASAERENTALENWAERHAEAMDACELDTTLVTDAPCPSGVAPHIARRALEVACDARGLVALDLAHEGWRAYCRSGTVTRSTVALVPGGSEAPWARVMAAALSRQRLQAIMVLTDDREGGTRRATNADVADASARQEYPEVLVEQVFAAEAAVEYGGVTPSRPAAAWRWRARAAWHHRRGDGAGAVARLRRAAEVSFHDGAWKAALRSSRAAIEACASGGHGGQAVEAGALCARVLLEMADTSRAAQIATVVVAAAPHTGAAAVVVGDACMTLAEVAELRGQAHVARRWLERCPSAVADSSRARAIGMRLALASGDLVRAAHLAHAIGIDADGHHAASCVPSLIAAARVHARLGDSTRAASALAHAARLARVRRQAGDAAAVRAASAAMAARYGRRFAPRVRGGGGRLALDRTISPRAREAARRLRAGEAEPTAASNRTPGPAGTGALEWEPVVVNEVVAILRLSQGGADEIEIAERVCRFLRERWRATSAGVWLPGEWRAPVAGVGRCELPQGFGERVSGVDWVVGPVAATACAVESSRGDDGARGSGVGQDADVVAEGTSAGVSVRYAGDVVGILALRWPAEPVVSADHLHAVLSAAAVALGPAIAAVGDRREPVSPSTDTLGFLGTSRVMQELRELVRRASTLPFPVLVLGESGSGKELVARAIHAASPRRARRFCAVNCAALTDELFDAELFGHAKGAFTGAIHERRGLFEEADGGTLFLDEVGELSPRAQAKLLRALQEREIRRVGENTPRRVDVRLIAATNRDLVAAARAGGFRVDLLYRLDVIRVLVPPLRAREDDVLLLAHVFWRQAVDRIQTKATLGAEVLAALARYHWPGNVRELQNVMTALAVSAPRRGRVEPRHLPAALVCARADDVLLPLAEARQRFDQEYVRRALLHSGGSRVGAARLLGITRQGLSKMLNRHGGADRTSLRPAERGPKAQLA